jgi:hypothetical protein
MDPELLRVMTDPEARKDPARLQAALARVNSDAQRDALNAVRRNAIVMGVLGVGVSLGGVALFAAGQAGAVPSFVGYAGFGLVAMGAVFVALSRMTALPPRALLRDGVACEATVRAVKGVGRSIGIERPGAQVTLSKVTVVLAVPQPNGAVVEVEHSQFVVGLARLQVGAQVPVRVDPRNPRRLALVED